MHKLGQQGFSFLEMVVVLALIGLLGAFAVPNLFRTQKGAVRKEFLASFQLLLKDCLLRSVVENKMHQVFIDIEHELIQVREFDPTSIETNQHKKFKKVVDGQYLTEITFPKRFVIQNFFINGVDEVATGNLMLDVAFYMMPDGTSQAVIANFVDQDNDSTVPDATLSCVINPFYARVVVHETFQTP